MFSIQINGILSSLGILYVMQIFWPQERSYLHISRGDQQRVHHPLSALPVRIGDYNKSGSSLSKQVFIYILYLAQMKERRKSFYGEGREGWCRVRLLQIYGKFCGYILGRVGGVLLSPRVYSNNYGHDTVIFTMLYLKVNFLKQPAWPMYTEQ